MFQCMRLVVPLNPFRVGGSVSSVASLRVLGNPLSHLPSQEEVIPWIPWIHPKETWRGREWE